MKSIYQVWPITEACKEWFNENVDIPSYLYFGESICIESRFLDDIIHGMDDAGLEYAEDYEIQ